MKQKIIEKANLLSFLHNMYRISDMNSFTQSSNQKARYNSTDKHTDGLDGLTEEKTAAD